MLESAVADLSDARLAEAYASYNLADARFASGAATACRAPRPVRAVQGQRKEIDRLRKQVDRRCRGDED